MWFRRAIIESEGRGIPIWVDSSETYIYPTFFLEYFSNAPKMTFGKLDSQEIGQEEVIEVLENLLEESENVLEEEDPEEDLACA